MRLVRIRRINRGVIIEVNPFKCFPWVRRDCVCIMFIR